LRKLLPRNAECGVLREPGCEPSSRSYWGDRVGDHRGAGSLGQAENDCAATQPGWRASAWGSRETR